MTSVVVVSVPWKVKVFTSPILLKKGTIVSRTKRRSLETTACTVMNVPSESTTITGCWAAAKSPTTGHHADHERRLRGVGDERLLAVEERDLGGLEHVAAAVALGGVDEEEGLDVAEDGEAQRGPGRGVEAAELRHGQREAALLEGDVQVGGEDARLRRVGADVAAGRRPTSPASAVAADAAWRPSARRWSTGWIGPKPAAAGSLMFSLMLKSKSTPIRSKKLSLSVMKRTSMVTCRSCMRRNCSSRSTISSWTSCVWLTTMLRLVSKGAIEPGPPTVSQVVGCTVEVIRSMRLSKSALVPPPKPPGPKPIGMFACPAAAAAAHAGLPRRCICASTLGLMRRAALLAVLAGHHRQRRADGAEGAARRRRSRCCPRRRGRRRPGPCAGWPRSWESASPGRPRCRSPCRPGPTRICSLVIFSTSSLIT